MASLMDLLEQLDRSRERLLVAIEMLPDEALLQTAVVGRYSVADVLALLTAWEAELVTGLMRLDQGKKPGKLLSALADPDAYEAQRYEEIRERDLDQIFADWQQVRVQLEGWLEEFPERALGDKKRFKGLHGRSLARLVQEITIEREKRFLPALQAFAREWKAAHADEPEPIIPLTAVSLDNGSQNGSTEKEHDDYR